MVEFSKKLYKDIGLQREVEDALPYAVVGGEYEASMEVGMYGTQYEVALSHVVPNGQQLKILFLRVGTDRAGGRTFQIYQTNPTATGATGNVEAYPVVGNVPSGDRDFPYLESAGAEILRGSLVDPVHVLEGSIEFRILAESPGGAAAPDATGDRDIIVFCGVEKIPEPYR